MLHTATHIHSDHEINIRDIAIIEKAILVEHEESDDSAAPVSDSEESAEKLDSECILYIRLPAL